VCATGLASYLPCKATRSSKGIARWSVTWPTTGTNRSRIVELHPSVTDEVSVMTNPWFVMPSAQSLMPSLVTA
jgi:hypothetical protein